MNFTEIHLLIGCVYLQDIGNPPGSPTSFMYADSQDIKEHYHDVIDPEFHDPLTPGMQNQQDFGRSGLPEWNLPLIDGEKYYPSVISECL